MKRYWYTVMQNLSSLLLIIMVLSITVSCNRNKLKTDEKSLVQTIRTEEEQLAYEQQQREEQEKQLADSLAKLPKGFRFKEDRNVEQGNMPKIINIAKKPTDTVSLVLSDVVKSVEYIRLDPIPDSTNLRNGTFSAKLTSKYIIVYGVSGIYLYNRDGKFLKPIIQNEIKNMGIENMYRGVRTSWSSGNLFYRGQVGEVWVLGDNLYYTTVDFEKQKYSYRQYNLETPGSTITLPTSVERIPPELPGKEIARLTKGQAGSFQNRFTSVATTIPLGEHIFINVPSAWSTASKGTNLVMYGPGNDTICKFSNNNTVQNYPHTLISRGDTRNRRYFFNGQLFIYPMFSDTVFKVILPNKLIPEYVFDFGEYKPTPNEYFSPGELSGKIYLSSDIVETSNKIFFEYFDIDGIEKFGIYRKQTGEFITVSNCKHGLPDDSDGFLSYWPKTLNSQNEECKILLASSLKYLIQNPLLEHPEASRKQETKRFIEQLDENDHVAIIYKLK
ncbi:hypothetical protein ACE01N_01690 [Saccharicrinis sp. FJH2]|uniref:hypothetical protein n=1 Tax=Saccharicrinis sp. FJH65 TaxID=3344659 RepID=UPI0035F3FE6B